MLLKEKITATNAEFLNHFITAAYEAFKFETGTDLEKVKIAYDSSSLTSNDITVMFGVIGEVRGYISLAMSENTATRIACALLKCEISDINLVTRAIYAIGQEISTRAGNYLNTMGVDCIATPPTVVCGKGVKMSVPNVNKISVGMNSKLGSVEMKAAFTE